MLVYFRIGQELRLGPFLMVLLSLGLLGLTYLPPGTLVAVEWFGAQSRLLVIGLVIFSVLLYMLNVVISRISYVQARPENLYIRAGLVPQVVSYTRIRQLRPVQVGKQYPKSSLKGPEFDLLEPYMGQTAVAMDLKAFPMEEKMLRRLWSKFLFTTDQKGLLFIVEDYQLLKHEIDAHNQARKAGSQGESGDIFERVAGRHRN